MESERDNTTDDQLLTVQEIAGLLRFRVLGMGTFANAPQTASPPTDSQILAL